jgi:hypothetical protein
MIELQRIFPIFENVHPLKFIIHSSPDRSGIKMHESGIMEYWNNGIMEG